MNKIKNILRSKYYIFIILILIIIIIILGFKLTKKEYQNKYEIKVSSTDNFVFVGDSITFQYSLEEYYDELPVVNSGIEGNKTTDLLSDMKNRIFKYNPTKVFLLIGTNDLNVDDELIADKTYKNIKKIIKSIKKNRPNAKIYVESIYPINSNIENNTVYFRTKENIKKVNKNLEIYCNNENCQYVNIYKSLVDSKGNLNKKYTTDGLHLNSLGYVVVTRELLTYLND